MTRRRAGPTKANGQQRPGGKPPPIFARMLPLFPPSLPPLDRSRPSGSIKSADDKMMRGVFSLAERL